MHRITLAKIAMIAMIAMGASTAVLAASEPLNPRTIILNHPVTFVVPDDGGRAVIPPGPYLLEPVTDSLLKLVPLRGGVPVTVKATSFTHRLPLVEPVAVASPEGDATFQITLLFPDGRGLEAQGTSDAIRTRGINESNIISLSHSVHFASTDGSDVMTPPDTYRVEAISQTQLGLIQASNKMSRIVQAVETTHDRDLSAPIVEQTTDADLATHVLLLFPGGRGLEAIGSPSGVRTRGTAIMQLGRVRTQVMVQQEIPARAAATTPTVVLTPPNGPSGTVVKVTAFGFPAYSNTQDMQAADVGLDSGLVEKVNLLPCSNGGFGIGETCGTPPLMLKIEGAPGFQRSVRVEARGLFNSGSSANAVFAIDVAPPVGQTQIPGPEVYLSHTHGPTGTMVEVSACGFPGNLRGRRAFISVDGKQTGNAALFPCRADGAMGFNMASMGRTPRTLITVEGPPGPKMIRLDTDIKGIPVGERPFTIDPGPPPAYSPRFALVWDGIAVLDKDTGLIWERAPDRSVAYGWRDGRGLCRSKTVGNHIGWRLPALGELASLIDLSQRSPALPSGHPFVPPPVLTSFWSATLDRDNPQNALVVDIDRGSNFTRLNSDAQTAGNWCVWSALALDQQ